ncbi:Cytochrome P450 monooxygenase aclL [Colletotrichum tropicale]|nr:Cytochrome P450 monooxygenase aclL [Colletotrichum tropicale]
MFISRLHETASQPGGNVISITRWLNLLTTDIIGELTFAESFEGLAKHRLHPWLESVFLTLKAFTFIRELTRLPPLFLRLATACIPTKMLEHQRSAVAFGAKAARRRMGLGTERPDFMSYILRQTGEQRMTEPEIEAAAITFIVAGSETTATMLSGTVYLLCQNRAILDRLTSLVRADFPSESDLTLVNLQQHEYLNAVLQEGLRLYPPAPDNLFRVTPDSGGLVMGELLPPKTSLTVNLWAANRSSENFHRPNEFIPERWFKDPPDEFRQDEKNAMRPFSVGPRDCIGKNLAWAEMRMILAHLVWNFNLELESGSQGWIERQKVFMLWEKPELNVKISKRE